MRARLRVYSDGASRGNPGPSAIAFTVLNEDGKVLKKHSEYVGLRTNNQVEYEALISALKFASGLPNREIICHLDSELVVKHLNGEYRVKNPKLEVLWLKVHELKQGFQKMSFVHVPRTDVYIRVVDRLANEALDRAGYKR